ncbi:MAG: hypothetical protein IT260_24410 [Saprospiraceae bacterium]|nr:hypothetical protein [Saprospiraceae bacterium]
MNILQKIYFIYSFLVVLTQTALSAQSTWGLDLDFGKGGKVEIRDSTKLYVSSSTVLRSDNKILVMSLCTDLNGTTEKIILTCLSPNGSLDSMFGEKGQAYLDVNIDWGGFGGMSKIARTMDNKLICCGYTSQNSKGFAFVIRVNTNGSLDKTFGQDGVFTFDLGTGLDKFLSILINPDGKILLGGFSVQSYQNRALLVQLLPDGSLDPNFASNGIYVSNPTSTYKTIRSLALQEDGKIVTFGSNGYPSDMEVFRFYPDGKVDTSFGINGGILYGYPDQTDMALVGNVQNDGKIIFSGPSYYTDTIDKIKVVRLNPNGSVDNNFGINGQLLCDWGLSEFINHMVVQPDMKILLGTWAYSGTNQHNNFFLARYNSDGTLDESFGDNGLIKSIGYDGIIDQGDILLDEAGKITCVNIIESNLVLWRYQNNNALETKDTRAAVGLTFDFTPNPVSSHGQFTWTMQSPGELSSDLLDTQGRLVQHLIPPTFYPAGSHQQEVYFENNIPAGVYSLVVTTGGERQVLKLVKL